MKAVNQNQAIKKDRYRPHRGEPGCGVVTPIINGEPITENLPIVPDSPPSYTIEELRGLLLPRDETAHYRFNLIYAVEQELKKNKSLDEILKDFNSGQFLEHTFGKLGHVSRRTFFRWKSALSGGDIKSLIPRTGRKNTSKIENVEIEAVLKYFFQPSQPSMAESIYRAKEELREKGIESPSSPDILGRFVNRVKKERADLCIYYREGGKAAEDKVFPYHERDWERLEVGDLIVGDGHTLNFQVENPYTGKPCRPVVVFLWDWRSSFVLGWEVMLSESIQCITSALRNAIICLGKKPRWIYLDNGKAFRAKVFTSDINLTDTEILGMFKRLGIEPHFALRYSARSKPVERIFRIFDEQLERLVPSYVGNSIGGKPAWLKPNEKFARSMHNPHVPTIEETNNLILGWRNRYGDTPTRARDGLGPKDIFDQGKGPGVKLSELDDLMMSREIRKVHRNGVTWLGRHWYNEALCGLNDRVVIRYTYSDLSQIYIYYKNEFFCIAKPVQKVHPMASESGDPKDMEELNRQRAQFARIRKDVIKVCREGGPKVLERLPLKEIVYNVPGIDKDIEKIEAEKSRAKFISPFVDEPVESDSCIATVEETKTDMAADHGSRLSCPNFKSDWEQFEWYIRNNPKSYNIADLIRIDSFIDSTLHKNIYENESGKSTLENLRSKRFVESGQTEDEISVPYDQNDQNVETYNDVSGDPAIENRWIHLKKAITIDPISGLSHPGNGTLLRDESDRYGWYRGIERRFPGTLTDVDWREVKKYEESEEWKLWFGYCGLRNPHLRSRLTRTDYEEEESPVPILLVGEDAGQIR